MTMTRTVSRRLSAVLQTHGLIILGWLPPRRGTPIAWSSNGDTTLLPSSGRVAIVGNAGPAMWDAFCESPEFAEGKAGRMHDPLDAWTRRVTGDAARRVGARVLYPFEGPPYVPFQRWMAATGAAAPSPVGLLVHADYGLWFALRAALIFEEEEEGDWTDQAVEPARAAPCDTCNAKPCLAACPVGAFANGHYDVDACAAHVASPRGQDCRDHGCLVRHACPVGPEYAYAPDQAQFHMGAFLRGRS